jgi:hypothetical protein
MKNNSLRKDLELSKIIDGVNVAGCLYSTIDGGCTMLKTCKGNNCYYKQCIHKEQKLDTVYKALEKIMKIALQYCNSDMVETIYLSPFENDFYKILTIINEVINTQRTQEG